MACRTSLRLVAAFDDPLRQICNTDAKTVISLPQLFGMVLLDVIPDRGSHSLDDNNLSELPDQTKRAAIALLHRSGAETVILVGYGERISSSTTCPQCKDPWITFLRCMSGVPSVTNGFSETAVAICSL